MEGGGEGSFGKNSLTSTILVNFTKMVVFQIPIVYSFMTDVYFQKQPPAVFCKKGVIKIFPKFTRKHKQFAKFLRKAFLQDTSGRLILYFIA